ncbi:hypothetical protein [Desulfonema limicola]|uniref:hypothetical protein n=1 Tax=Desulfonema limicola TaxID=45656 RepID=UPI001A9B8B59|nr:hypothetical protein [Desulfonema limicola]
MNNTKTNPCKVMLSPRSVDIEITSSCNLNCIYCYYFNNPEVKYHDLPVEQWIRFFKELGDCRVMNVTIQGENLFCAGI